MSFVLLTKPPLSSTATAVDMSSLSSSSNATPTSTSHSPAPSPSPANGSSPHTPPPVYGANPEPAAAENVAAVSPNSTPPSAVDADKQIIIEALKSKDRIYVLKLGEQMESMIKERRQRLDLTSTTSYQRLLIRRCSAYYKLALESDPITKSITVLLTPESRIPELRVCELVPPESSSQPTFKKIMLRKPTSSGSAAGSVAGEDADLSDVEPSEAGSLGGRSNASKRHMTIEEREAAYNKARSRIFMDFEEKDKAKESHLSASSSSLSLNSTSASTSANGDLSSIGDTEGSVSSPTTESEWSVPSGPVNRERKDNRRGNASASSSSRSIRSGAASYGSNNSSRNSRASSPSFTYASLYEPAPTGQLYDPNQPPNSGNSAYSGTQYYHPFVPPAQQPYMPQYQYYSPYPYQAPPPDPHHTASDPSLPRGMDQYFPPPPPPPAANYGGPYMWSPHGQPAPAGQPMSTSAHHTHQPQGHMSPPPMPPHQYGYTQPPYPYPVPGYYPPHQPPPGQPMAPPPPPVGMQNTMYELPRGAIGGPSGLSGNGSSSAPPHPYQGPFSQNGRGNLGNGAIPQQPQQLVQQQQHPRNNQRNNPGLSANGNGGGKRNAPTSGRTWSYGSGSSGNGYNSSSGPDTVGPRLNSSRRQSNNSASGSSYSRASSNNDDVSSIASSSTSSSSRRTYTSTASSQHPLPPRPDWAVGLKAQPTLASRELNPRHPGLPISPARSVNGNHQSSRQTPPVSLQNDFPPLTPMAMSQDKRPGIPNGAWGNAPNRSILSPPGGTRSDDGERGSERPSPKNTELYIPRLARRPTSANEDFDSGIDGDGLEGSESLGNTHLTEQLVNQIQSITIEEKIAAVELASSTSMMVAVESRNNAAAAATT